MELEEQWKIFKESVYTAAAHILGFVKGKQRGCFNENEINILINRLHEATSQQKLQRTWQMENNWWDKIAEDLQFAADMQFLGLSMQVWCCSWAKKHWLNSRPHL